MIYVKNMSFILKNIQWGVKFARDYRYLTGNIEPGLSRPQEVKQKKNLY
jgi:hypothetical protein